MVQLEAKVCRYCGAKFSTGMNGTFWAVVVGIALLAWIGASGDNPDENVGSNAVATVEPLSAEVRQQCTEQLQKGIDGQVITNRPKPSRIEVPDAVWSQIDADAKRNMMAAVACDAFGKKSDDLNYSQYVVVYGATSGKRLAMLSSDGVKFE